MNRFEWASSGTVRGALALLALSAALFAWSVADAVRAPRPVESPAPEFAGSLVTAPPSPASGGEIAAAVDADLFAPDRSAPAREYRVPGDETGEVLPAAAPVLPVVLGTAMSDSAHSFATVQLGDERSVIMRIGDRIGEYTVRRIARGKVTFTNAAKKTLEIQELKP